MNIVHIIFEEEWKYVKQEKDYLPPSLHSEGFIHCSGIDQVIKVADYNFHGQTGLVLLVIDTEKVIPEVKWEDLYNLGEDYPHIYGPLNTDAVVDVKELLMNEDGSFRLE